VPLGSVVVTILGSICIGVPLGLGLANGVVVGLAIGVGLACGVAVALGGGLGLGCGVAVSLGGGLGVILGSIVIDNTLESHPYAFVAVTLK